MTTSQGTKSKISVARLIDITADERGDVVVIYQGASGYIHREAASTLLRRIGRQQALMRDKDPEDPYPSEDLMCGSFQLTLKNGHEYHKPLMCKEAVELFLSVFCGEV